MSDDVHLDSDRINLVRKLYRNKFELLASMRLWVLGMCGACGFLPGLVLLNSKLLVLGLPIIFLIRNDLYCLVKTDKAFRVSMFLIILVGSVSLGVSVIVNRFELVFVPLFLVTGWAIYFFLMFCREIENKF